MVAEAGNWMQGTDLWKIGVGAGAQWGKCPEKEARVAGPEPCSGQGFTANKLGELLQKTAPKHAALKKGRGAEGPAGGQGRAPRAPCCCPRPDPDASEQEQRPGGGGPEPEGGAGPRMRARANERRDGGAGWELGAAAARVTSHRGCVRVAPMAAVKGLAGGQGSPRRAPHSVSVPRPRWERGLWPPGPCPQHAGRTSVPKRRLQRGRRDADPRRAPRRPRALPASAHAAPPVPRARWPGSARPQAEKRVAINSSHSF